VPYESLRDPAEAITALRSEGYTILALELSISSHHIQQLQLGRDDKVCLILGNERRGIEQSLLRSADAAIHIPMQGQNSSMNVAMAAAIASWEIVSRLSPDIS